MTTKTECNEYIEQYLKRNYDSGRKLQEALSNSLNLDKDRFWTSFDEDNIVQKLWEATGGDISFLKNMVFSVEDFDECKKYLSSEQRKVFETKIIKKIQEEAIKQEKDQAKKEQIENINTDSCESTDDIIKEIEKISFPEYKGKIEDLQEEQKDQLLQKYQQLKNIFIANEELFEDVLNQTYSEGNKENKEKYEAVNLFVKKEMNHLQKAKEEARIKYNEDIDKTLSPFQRILSSEQLLKKRKYPLPDEELAKMNYETKKELKDIAAEIEKKVEEVQNLDNSILTLQHDYMETVDIQKQEEILKHINEKQKGNKRLWEEIESLKNDYKILQLPKDEQTRLNALKERNFNYNALLKESNINWESWKNILQNYLNALANETYSDLEQQDIIQLSKKNKEYFKNYLTDLVDLDKDPITISYEVKTKKDKPETKGRELPIKKIFNNGNTQNPLSFEIDLSNADHNIDPQILQLLKTHPSYNPKTNKLELDSNNAMMLFTILQGYHPSEDTIDETKTNSQIDAGNEKANLEEFNTLRNEKWRGYNFEKGLKIWLPCGETELPSNKNHAKQRLKAEMIHDSPDYFEIEIKGGELKLANQKEGERITITKNAENLERWGDFIVTKGNNFEETKETLKKQGKDTEKILKDIQFDGQDFTFNTSNKKKNGQTVKYFAAPWNPPILYNITPKGNKINVHTEFLKDNKKLIYDKEMDYDQFLIFLSERNLEPKTKEEGDSIQNKKINQENKIFDTIKTRKWKRFSLNSIKEGLKDARWKIKEGFEAPNKKNAEDFKDRLYGTGDFDLYGKLSKYLGRLPGMNDYGLEKRREQEGKESKGAMGKIDKYLDQFEKDNKFKDNFFAAQNYVDQFKCTISQKIFNGKNPKNATINDVQTFENNNDIRPIMAAAMCALMKKGKGLYLKMDHLEKEGMWIKLILWEGKRQDFLKKREELVKKIEEKGGDKQLSDLYSRAEIQYIINDVKGDEREFLGRWKRTDKFVHSIPFDFGVKLESYYREYNGIDMRDNEYKEQKGNLSFSTTTEEFKKALQNRKQVRWGDLKAMMDLINGENDRHKDIQAAILTTFLSGQVNELSKAKKTYLTQMMRSYSYAPWLLANYPKNEQLVLDFLDTVDQHIQTKKGTAPNHKLKEELEKYMENSGKPANIYKLYETVYKYFNENDNFKELETFLKKDLYTKDRKDNDALSKMKSKILEAPDSIDHDLNEADDIMTHRWLASSDSAINKLRGFDDGSFNGNEDEVNRKIAFWNEITGEIDKIDKDGKDEDVKYIYDKFQKFFGFSSYGENILKSIIYPEKAEPTDQRKQQTITNNEKKILEAYLIGENSNTVKQLPKEYRKALERFIDYLYDHRDTIGKNILKEDGEPKALPLETIKTQLKNIRERLNRVKGYDYNIDKIL